MKNWGKTVFGDKKIKEQAWDDKNQFIKADVTEGPAYIALC